MGSESGKPKDRDPVSKVIGMDWNPAVDRIVYSVLILLTVYYLFFIPGMLRSFFSYFPSLVNEYGIHRPNVKSTRSPCLKR
jgi:hypothetical protein